MVDAGLDATPAGVVTGVDAPGVKDGCGVGFAMSIAAAGETA
ncbi:MAG: hypothetical protein ACRDJH_20880 [Thermomicrobiales bacterium]